MQPLLIVKAGSTFPELAKTSGDFEAWIERGLGFSQGATLSVDVQKGAALPSPESLSGCVVTGSHDNVTDELPWMKPLAGWLRSAVNSNLPILGICFGHQILADALGGVAGVHPKGPEIGTVMVNLTAAAADDPIFSRLPNRFPAHVTHMQTVLSLPVGATLLARNGHDPHHAFRLGRHAWGVQFHPEFDADATRSYTRAQADVLAQYGRDANAIAAEIVATPQSADLLPLFARYCRKRLL